MKDRGGSRLLRPIAAILLAAVLLCAPGCGLVWPQTPGSEPDPSTAPSTSATGELHTYTEEYRGAWCYLRLDYALQSDYRALYSAVREADGKDETVSIADNETGEEHLYTGLKIKLPQPLHSREEAQELFNAFTRDNPQFFYIANIYSYEGYRSGGTEYYNTFCLVFSMNAAERAAAGERLNALLLQWDLEWQEEAKNGDFETELFYHDKLMETCSYAEEVAALEDPVSRYPNAFSAYGALVEGRAVCEGYARAMQLLMQRRGIPCTLVTGFDDKNASHMWNMVTVNGRNYHLDPTWNDSGRQPQHVYFNLTTEEILRTHTLDRDNIGIDTCTATNDNFYIKTGAYISRFSVDQMADIAAAQLRRGSPTVEFRFSDDSYRTGQTYVGSHDLLVFRVNQRLNSGAWDYSDYSTNDDYTTIVIYALD